MPLHVAKKKIPTVHPDGTPLVPTANNGIKLELFICERGCLRPDAAALHSPLALAAAPLPTAFPSHAARAAASAPIHVDCPDHTAERPSGRGAVDTFPKAQRMAVLQVPRAEEFAPVKNPPGAANDSPDTARELIYALGRRRLLEAGGRLVGDVLGGKGIVEISPLVSYQGEGLRRLCKDNAEFALPVTLEQPTGR